MTEITTIEELFKKYSNLYQFEEGSPEYLIDKEDFKNAMIEFTKFHCEAQSKAILEKAKIKTVHHEYYTSDYDLEKNEQEYFISTDGDGCPYAITKCSINENSILNAYSLENIK